MVLTLSVVIEFEKFVESANPYTTDFELYVSSLNIKAVQIYVFVNPVQVACVLKKLFCEDITFCANFF